MASQTTDFASCLTLLSKKNSCREEAWHSHHYKHKPVTICQLWAKQANLKSPRNTSIPQIQPPQPSWKGTTLMGIPRGNCLWQVLQLPLSYLSCLLKTQKRNFSTTKVQPPRTKVLGTVKCTEMDVVLLMEMTLKKIHYNLYCCCTLRGYTRSFYLTFSWSLLYAVS